MSALMAKPALGENLLDLRPDGIRSPADERALAEEAMAAREEFTIVIDGLTQAVSGRHSWLFSTPASRNPLTSDLFFRCAALALLQRRIERGCPPARVLVDSPALASGLVSWLAARRSSCEIEVSPHRAGERIRRFPRAVRAVLGHAIWQLWLVRAARRSGGERFLPGGPLILVDTFLDRDRPLHDRYFPGLLDGLDMREAQAVRLVPSVYGQGLSGFSAMFATLRASGRFLLKEDYLTYGDCLGSCLKAVAACFQAVPAALFRGLDLAPLIREELRQCRDFAGTAGAFVNQAFARRLKRAGGRPCRLVSWFENQPVDKGLNAGFARHFPGTHRVGYQGFVPPSLHLSQFCTEGERRAGVAPDAVAVMGPALAEPARIFCPDLPCRVAPAFRFAYLHRVQPGQTRRTRRVLAALPLNLPDSLRILELLEGVGDRASADIEILVKVHPACPVDILLRERGRPLPADWLMVAKPMPEVLPECGLLVSVASSVCVEAVALGIPVAVAAGGRGLALNPLPESLRDGMWRPCFTADDLAMALDAFLGPGAPAAETFAEVAQRFRDAYFLPSGPAAARALLGLDAQSDPPADVWRETT